jgi:hypothetical protein
MAGVMSEVRTDARRARAIGIGWVQRFGRLGWVAKGVVYVLVGVLAVPIALSGGSSDEGEASQRGAIAEIADTSLGTVLLLVVGAGLALYALWRLVTALLPGENDADTLAHRAGYLFSAAIYGLLSWTALSWVVGGSGSSGSTSSGQQGGQTASGQQQSADERFLESVSRTLLDSTAGRWLLAIGALVGLGVAVYFAVKGVTGGFMEELDLGDASSEERTLLERTGQAGWIGRALMVGLMAVFVLYAAWTADPAQSEGLDGALRRVAQEWWGVLLVLGAGVGLVLYGVYAIVSARRQRLQGP